ncbi:MAG: hypothetical protein FWG98_13985 [Candidatus Cloacimonetes bacterium]|nr:hypothetical protein [Candidatus Cloacimonadota bacterium]
MIVFKKQVVSFFVLSFLFLGVLLFFITSCVKTRLLEPPIEEDVYWNHFLSKEDTTINFITNAAVAENLLLCTTVGIMTMFDDITSGVSFMKSLYHIATVFDTPPLLSRDLLIAPVVNKTDEILFIHYEKTSYSAGALLTSDFREDFADWSFEQRRTFGAMNDQNRFVTVMTNNNRGVPEHEIRNYIVYADIEIFPHPMSSAVRVVNTGHWRTPSMQGTALRIEDIFAFKDKFYISFFQFNQKNLDRWAYCVEISSDGTIKEFDNPFGYRLNNIYKFFEYDGYLFAHAIDKTLRYTVDGENWIALYTLTPVVNTFKVIDGFLFVHLKDNIYMIDDLLGDTKGYRLPKENRAGSTITAINKFKDDLVIATTHGLYYKSFEEVMNDKELAFSLDRGVLNLEGGL